MVMDLSFANQCFSVLHLTKSGKTLENRVSPVPKEIARLNLASMGVAIDKLSVAQKKYLEAWKEGARPFPAVISCPALVGGVGYHAHPA